MFIKVTKSGNHEYAQLVESFRENGMTRHMVMLNLGRLDHIKNNPSFQRIAKKLEELSTENYSTATSATSKMRKSSTMAIWPIAVSGKNMNYQTC